MNYVTRSGGATVTVFVPWDCWHNCPFCINKAEYADSSKFNIEEVKRSIRIMSVMTPNCDFVFSGGEPLSNLEGLYGLLQDVHQTGTNHKVFINTTIPTNDQQTIEVVANFLNKCYDNKLITGVNVSRHLRKYVTECDDKIFKLLNFEVRINCVVPDLEFAFEHDKLLEKLKMFIERFRGITKYIQFRADYVTTTPENLYVKYDASHPQNSDDKIFSALSEVFSFKTMYGAYRMRVGYEFDANGFRVTYHRTLPYSKIYLKTGAAVLYDIIVKQNGDIKEDWDTCTEQTNLSKRKCNNLALNLDLNAYRKVEFEDYR